MEFGAGEGWQQNEAYETLIAFFDVETTVPSSSCNSSGGGGVGYFLLEFGAILVCPRRLVEVDSFSTLVRPSDLNAISSLSVRCNGITRDSVASAPSFGDVADKIFSILHGKIWAGHNILRFDCTRIREAFGEIGRPSPEPRATIDTLPLLTKRFGRRAGNMKMATLACYFGLGPQKHRSLDDVRMNLEVLKYCAAVLFLESSLSNAPPFKNLESEITFTENHGYQNCISEKDSLCSQPECVSNLQSSSFWSKNVRNESSDLNQFDAPSPIEVAANLTEKIEQMKIDSSHSCSSSIGVNKAKFSAEYSPNANSYIGDIKSSCPLAGFLNPDEVFLDNITISLTHTNQFVKRIHILHQNAPLWLCCQGLVIKFGISTKFLDYAGRPKLSILVKAPESLCLVLSNCDSLAQSSFMSSGGNLEWRPLIQKSASSNPSTIRLHIPTIANGEAIDYCTEIFQREASGNMNKLVFSKSDIAGLDSVLSPGRTVDAFFSLESYVYQQNAGIRLVAKCLVVHSK
ncbi:hypothetical protein HPP92_005690 [Vanilla planifolia]|uniref:Exonuclease domain-containing protein n=1 Tax=Vanilla planifolia TaxID=51239 RepID=A0A835VFN3_VANPL|nr:hypothetical protein HPP92_005690 [Vanilla planifolia]